MRDESFLVGENVEADGADTLPWTLEDRTVVVAIVVMITWWQKRLYLAVVLVAFHTQTQAVLFHGTVDILELLHLDLAFERPGARDQLISYSNSMSPTWRAGNGGQWWKIGVCVRWCLRQIGRAHV